MTITLIVAAVEVEPGWAVGAVPLADPVVDRDLLLDASGQPWIPGCSLAGSLRAHLAAAEPPADVRIMGGRPPRNQAQAAQSTVSPLWVLGAVFTPHPAAGGGGAQATVETVGQTAVDRIRGAAAPGSLRISRVVGTGGNLTVYMRHDSVADPLSADDLELIADWQPAIGRDRTRGGGRASLTQLHHGTIDPATRDGATTWLTHTGVSLFDAVATHAVATQTIARTHDDKAWLEEEFEIADGLLIGASSTGPVARSRRRGARPLIPGSAWKGVIRSRVEFIIRSRYGDDAACQQQTGCGTCVVCAVFGHQGQRGVLAFRDSRIEDSAPETECTHVGIDRVTGGAKDALLFKTAPVRGGHLRLRIDALGRVEPWVRNTLGHVLRDMHDGLVGVGSRSTQGLGTLRLTNPLGKLEPVIIPRLESADDKEPRDDR